MDASRAKPLRGFTLIEIAVVIAIMMTLLTLGLGLMSAQLNSTAYSVTKKRQEAIKDALIAYLGSNKRLPCPYVPAVGSPVTGSALSQSGTPPACAAPAFGVVPFATLGLSREIGEDGWGNFFSYRIFADANPTCPGTQRDWGNSACFGEGKSGGLVVKDGTGTPPVDLSDSVVAVVVSHGANGLGAWAAQATRNASPTTCEEAHNAVGTTPPPACTLIANTYYKGERQENDDVVAYLTASDALQMLARQGVIKSAVAKVNDDLSLALDTALGDVLSQGCNWSSKSAKNPFSSPIDPWGNAYQKDFITASVSKTMASDANFAFCVYSYGPNGLTETPPGSVTSCVPANNAKSMSVTNGAMVGYLSKLNWPNC